MKNVVNATEPIQCGNKGSIVANGLGIGAVKPDLPKAKKGLSSILIGFHGTNPRVSHCTQAH